MARVLLGIVAALASIMLVESLVCNKCSFSLVGYCLSAGNETCEGADQMCFTKETKFDALKDFAGFNLQGCQNGNASCGEIFSGTFLGVKYESNHTCCSTDRCNSVKSSAAKMTFSTAMTATLLVTVWGSMQ